jgi:ABC-type nitrate/sulfonate/bicarbonate transport system ATPase subunit
MSAPPIVLREVDKAFDRPDGGRRVVLDGFSLEVAPGELVALVGPSGCGKTTILNAVAGLERVDGGEVVVGDARLGVVFQQPRLLDWVTARENVALAARAAGRPDDAVDALLEAVGLADHADAFPPALSGGQRQRVAVARAFVVQPDVVLLDEPFSALDELTARRLRLLLQELWLDGTRTGLLVTHNPLEAALLADRVVVLEPAPARIVQEHHVTAARPRSPEDEALFALHREILGALV